MNVRNISINCSIIVDDYGAVWSYIKPRLYMEAAEREEPDSNGFYIQSLDEAIALLIEYGYISEDRFEKKEHENYKRIS